MERPFIFLDRESFRTLLKQESVGFEIQYGPTGVRTITRSKQRVPASCREWYRKLLREEHMSVLGTVGGGRENVIYLYPPEHWKRIEEYIAARRAALKEESGGEGKKESRMIRLFLSTCQLLDMGGSRFRLPLMQLIFLSRDDAAEEDVIPVKAYRHEPSGTVILVPEGEESHHYPNP